MRKQFLTLVLAAAVSAATFVACSKSSDTPKGTDNGGGVTKEKLIGSYRITEIKEVTADGTEDILAEQSSCDRDNIFQLKGDMTLAVIDAGEQCSPSSDDTGAWEYKDSKTIVLNGTTFTIKSFSGSTLKMSYTEGEGDDQYTLNLTYVKQ